MKKISSFIILALITFASLCGCQNSSKNEIAKDNIYVEGQDYQYQFSHSYYDDNKINKAENGYYFTHNQFLYFLDENTMQATPLCNKPNCLHDKETVKSEKLKCNAYIATVDDLYGQSIYYYDGNIYYAQLNIDDGGHGANTEIIKCSSDGNNKEVIAAFKDSKYFHMLVHRGYLYYTMTTFTATDKKDSDTTCLVESDTEICRIDLRKKDYTSEVFIKKSNFGKISSEKTLQFYSISAYGNYLLLMGETPIHYYEISSQGNCSYSDDPMQYYTVNLKTKEISNLTEVELPEKNAQYSRFTYLNGKLLFTLYKSENNINTELANIYTMNFDGTDVKKVFERPKEFKDGYVGTDNNYIYVCGYKNSEYKIIQIYDYSFKLLNTVKLPIESEVDNHTLILSSDGDKLLNWGIIEDTGEDENYFTSEYYVKYINKSELLKSSDALAWKYAYKFELKKSI